MASGALPPAFGAIRIDGEPYWDGGIYSNTPIEAVLDDKPRRGFADLRGQRLGTRRAPERSRSGR
jgi:predicted acylesterase/phospholipase RssA